MIARLMTCVHRISCKYDFLCCIWVRIILDNEDKAAPFKLLLDECTGLEPVLSFSPRFGVGADHGKHAGGPRHMKIAFVGLGAMGNPMARNLRSRGFQVSGFDITEKSKKAWFDAGGDLAASSVDACLSADIIVLMVVNAAQAERILFADSALQGAKKDAIVCLMATCPPKTVEMLAASVLATGRGFIDAPVSGGTEGAVAGTLTIMAAGSPSSMTVARPIFEAMAKRIFQIGERPGQGAAVKMINQLLCGVHVAVAAEAFSLADKVGVPLPTLLEIVSGTAASSWMLKDRGPRMIEESSEVTNTIDVFVKDLGIVLEAGRETRSALPLVALCHQLFLSVSGSGRGSADDSQIIQAYRALNGG